MTLYDKLDWHEGAALEAGFPREHGFTHIGFFVAWLIRRDLHDPGWFPADYVGLVKRGEMTGTDLSDLVDNKLVSHVMSREGTAFADARYGTYMTEYGQLFADLGDYGVPDEHENFAKAERLLDDLYASWVGEGRPRGEEAADDAASAPIPGGFTVITPPGYSDEDWAEVVRRAGVGQPFEPPPQDERLMPHAAPELEALIPRDITAPPTALSSVSATQWGSSLLNRALKRLGVRPRDVVVANGVGGRGEEAVMVAVYGIPGVPRNKLDAEFAPGLATPGGKWQKVDVGGTLVNWATGHGLAAAYWARDGVVYHIGGREDMTKRAVERIVAAHRDE